MKPILVDTSGYSQFRRGDADAVAVIQNAWIIGVNPVVIGELLAGFSFGSQAARNRHDLDRFLALPHARQVAIDRTTADLYADLYRTLRAVGTPIPTNDLWIAASAREHGFAVFTFDAHFKCVPNLQVGKSVAELQ